MRKTNPIPLLGQMLGTARPTKRGPLTGGIVQNKRNSARPRADAGGKMRKTNQIWPARPEMGAGWRVAIPGRRAIVRNEANFGSNRAKRTQFGPAAGTRRRKLCKTKPNLGGLGYAGKGCRMGRGSAGSETCRTNPISRLRIADWGLRIGRGRAGLPRGGTPCRGNPRRAEACKTNPIWGRRPRIAD
jgi:hypothetical protein